MDWSKYVYELQHPTGYRSGSSKCLCLSQQLQQEKLRYRFLCSQADSPDAMPISISTKILDPSDY